MRSKLQLSPAKAESEEGTQNKLLQMKTLVVSTSIVENYSKYNKKY